MLTVSLRIFYFLMGLLGFAAAAQPALTQAQTAVELPKTITFVVPFAAGGGVDVQTRIVSRHLPKYLPGAPAMIVKNEVGAGGRAGVQLVFRSKPDGSLIGATYAPDALGSQAQYGVEGAGYDFNKFVLLGSTYHQPYTFSVGPQTPYRNLNDLKKAGKAVSFCVTGGIDVAYVVIAAKVVGFPFRLIPGYKGAPLAVAGMLRGDCEAVSFGIEFTNRYLKEGVRPITVHAKERDKLWPTVPTSREQGYPMDLQINIVFFLAPGNPPDLTKVMRDGLSKLYQDTEFQDAIRAAKYTPTFGDTKQTGEIVTGLAELFSRYASDLKEAAQKIQ